MRNWRANLTTLCPLAAWVALVIAPLAAAAADDNASDDPYALRLELTTRIDKRRPAPPRSINFRGRPLILSGEYEVEMGWDQQLAFGEDSGNQNHTRIEQDFQVELFYSITDKLAVYLEGEFEWEKDLHNSGETLESTQFFERGESWVYARNVRDSGLDFEAGRLDFEDVRRWWWDEELDAMRVSYRTETVLLSLGVAQELLPVNTEDGDIEPEHEDVLRLFGHASWNYAPSHRIGVFSLVHRDHSSREREGDIVDEDDEDESDADLTWVGARLSGEFQSVGGGHIEYWLDGASVWGHELISEYEEESRGRSLVDGTQRRSVSGWGLDGGATWHLPLAYKPRLTLGYAFGSGDSSPDSGGDRSFRQTGIQDNQTSFGNVRRFPTYGLILRPELSNLHIGSAGIGFSLAPRTSLDFVYHYYSQAQPADFMRNSAIDAELDGRSREIGHVLDVVLAIEEWERFDVEFRGSTFRTGDAFGTESGKTTYQGFVAFRFYF